MVTPINMTFINEVQKHAVFCLNSSATYISSDFSDQFQLYSYGGAYTYTYGGASP